MGPTEVEKSTSVGGGEGDEVRKEENVKEEREGGNGERGGRR